EGGGSGAEMGRVDGQGRIAVEHAGVDQPDRGHHEGKFAADRTRHVVAVELPGLIELQRGVHENKQAEPRAFGPEWLEFVRIEIKAARLRGDYHAGKAEFVFAARQLA